MCKNYNNLTKEQLEQELAEFARINYEKGVLILDRDFKLKANIDMNEIGQIEKIDEIISIMRNLKHITSLRKYFVNDTQLVKDTLAQELLIHPITEEYAWKEPVPEDFVSREEFINRTGIFVTPQYFDYIYEIQFKESNLSVDEFIETYEKENIGDVMECKMQGTFKYCATDDLVSCMFLYDCIYEPNFWEIANCLARNYEEQYRHLWGQINELMLIAKEQRHDLEKCLEICQEMLSNNKKHILKEWQLTDEITS